MRLEAPRPFIPSQFVTIQIFAEKLSKTTTYLLDQRSKAFACLFPSE